MSLIATAALAQVPAQDSRNMNRPDTNTHFQFRGYKTLAEWETRRTHLRKQILSAAGLMPMPEKTPLNPQVFGRIENKDYSIEKVLLETMPGFYLGGNLYRPLGRSGKFPAVASPHGHWNYGRLEDSELGSIPARAINLARQGYVVFTYDMLGNNDTIQTPHTFDGEREQLWGFGPLALQLWDSIRVADFLLSLPDVDSTRLAATGASGGGTQTFLLTAVDDRVKFSAPVNMISAIMQGGCGCENASLLRVDAFNVEIGAMMAPRPMLMVSATGDWTRNTPKEEFPAVRSIYELYGAADKVENVHVDAPHNYNKASREAMYQFFAKHILGDQDASKYKEREIRVERLQDMLALSNRSLPSSALTFEHIREQWISNARRQSDLTRDPSELRERLTYSLLTEWPAKVLSEKDGERIVLTREGRGDRVPGLWIPGKFPAALVIHPDGAAAAKDSPQVKDLMKSGRAVLAIDAFQTGTAVAQREKPGEFPLTFNRSDDANRVQDILTALRFLEQSGSKEVRVIGLGKAGVWSLFASAVAGMPVKLEADLAGFLGRDQDFIDRFFVPGIQRAGGLKAALSLVDWVK